MISQTAEPVPKVVRSNEKPIHLLKETGSNREDKSFGNLSAIAIKSMQIAEEKSKQNNASAMHRQIELQRIAEEYMINK